jgi:putative flippase GtrA
MMSSKKNAFYMFIAVIVVLATIFQFVMYGQLSDHCSELSVGEAPLLSGIALTCSFLFNGLWLFSSGKYRKEQANNTLRRVSLLFWTAVITAGVAASGAALGQIQLYSVACPSIEQSDADLYRGLQYASITLLIISISFPHVYPAKKAPSATTETSSDAANKDETEREFLNPYASKHGDLAF